MSWLPNPFKSLRISDENTLSDTAIISGGGGVKEDLSELGETIGRQLRGVAAFLAPPPRPSPPPSVAKPAAQYSGDVHSRKLAGNSNDHVEIGGSSKSSLSTLSRKTATPSGLLRRNEVGITKEVVDFVTDISEWPECWTDFPISLNDDGFTMTQTQAEHISAIEKIVPGLTDLKTTLRSDMNERKFWMIYFILLIPRLNEYSLSLLSSPEVAEARNLLLKKVRNQRNSLTRGSQSDSKSNQCGEITEETSGENMALHEMSVGGCREVENSIQGSGEKVVEGEDYRRVSQNEDGISFSDLDYDTDFSNRLHAAGSCSSDGSSDWVRLKKRAERGESRTRKGQLTIRNRDSEGEESSNWLAIHEFDYYK